MKETGLETEQQYENTRKWVERFNAALEQEAQNGPPAGERDRMAWELGLVGLGGIRNTLLAQMRDYESRRDISPARDALALTTPPHRDTEQAAYRGI